MNEFEEKVALISGTSLIQAHFSCSISLLTDACLRNIMSVYRKITFFRQFQANLLSG